MGDKEDDGKQGAESKKKTKREQEAENRRQRIEEQAAKLQNQDLTSIAQQELGNKDDDAGRVNRRTFGYDDDNDGGADSDGGPLVELLRSIISLFQAPPKPPLPWKTYRREELEHFVEQKLGNPLWGTVVPSKRFWYWWKSKKKLDYCGEFTATYPLQKQGRGVCYWPDPSKGGGESYFGLWRADQPHEYGVFRWYDGDMYQGQWVDGEMQGYGTYQYSKHGAHPEDSYAGAYYKGHRQGTGVYRYADNRGVYLGEWLQGKMEGHGLMMYADGETYIGTWRKDRKEGSGVYVWGQDSGDSAGDKYEGQFKNGASHGVGRTLFGSGGWHKGYYAKGKMNGFGVLQTADGWEYLGGWRDDELHQEVVCSYMFGARKPVVQRYNMGNLISERAYDPASPDWSDTETAARSACNDGEEAAIQASAQKEVIARFVRRAKQSQQMAKDAEDEARYYAKAALKHKEFLLSWYGLKQYLVVE